MANISLPTNNVFTENWFKNTLIPLVNTIDDTVPTGDDSLAINSFVITSDRGDIGGIAGSTNQGKQIMVSGDGITAGNPSLVWLKMARRR